MSTYFGPFRGWQDQNRRPIVRKVLLITKISIGGDKHIELGLRGTEQSAVAEFRPPHFVCCRHRVIGECAAQRCGRSLIKQYPHTGSAPLPSVTRFPNCARCGAAQALPVRA